MTGFQFIAPTLKAAGWLCGGALIGAAYFWTLRWNIRLLAFGRAPLVALAVQVSRFLLLAGSLAAIADRCGAPPLFLAAAGILAVRATMIRRLEVAA
jgi:F1F0 ATPase subunit 2